MICIHSQCCLLPCNQHRHGSSSQKWLLICCVGPANWGWGGEPVPTSGNLAVQPARVTLPSTRPLSLQPMRRSTDSSHVSPGTQMIAPGRTRSAQIKQVDVTSPNKPNSNLCASGLLRSKHNLTTLLKITVSSYATRNHEHCTTAAIFTNSQGTWKRQR